MQFDDEKYTVGQSFNNKEITDLEAGPNSEDKSFMDEEEKYEVDVFNEENNTEHVAATFEVVTMETCYRDAGSWAGLSETHAESKLPLMTLSCQDKEVFLNCENKTTVEFLDSQKGIDFNGLRKRRTSKSDTVRTSVVGDGGLGRMPEEDKRSSAVSRIKDAPVDVVSDAKPKAADKKAGKQLKVTGKPAGRRISDGSHPLEEVRVKEDVEANNRKVHESLDNFIMQTIRCEPYMTFPVRPGDKPLQRLRSDVLENHVGGKVSRGSKGDCGSENMDVGMDVSVGTDSYAEADGLKDMYVGGSKGLGGLARGTQHSLKVPPGVVAFTQAAAKGTDLPGWPLLSPSKVNVTKCDKCSREFFSSLNYRRHVRLHRKSLTDKDLIKERVKVAEFWDKLTPDQASVVVNYENMEIEDLPGNVLVKALADTIHQPGVHSIPQGMTKAGLALLDLVQNKLSGFPLSSDRLLSILDDASEKTFLSGGTSVAYQRLVFTGDAGKVGLEEKNLIATTGFHVEVRLVKAWMADKEAEALRNQQALFKEEEAAQQKRARILEKKRMKKIRQKERKVSASPSVQELDNESLDDEGNPPGVEEDDSPTATGSSASSLASTQDLALPGTSDVDTSDEIGLLESKEEEVPSNTFTKGKKAGERDANHQLHGTYRTSGERDCVAQSANGLSESFVSVGRRSDHFAENGADDSTRCLKSSGEASQDSLRDGRVHPPFHYRSARSVDVYGSNHSRKFESDRNHVDYSRCESDKTTERRSLRVTRDRTRQEYTDSFQKPSVRGYEGRYADGSSQPGFKHSRRGNVFFARNELGNMELARSQQYRSKSLGMHKATSSTGGGQVVWTRKVPKPAVEESCKEVKEESVEVDLLGSKDVSMGTPVGNVGTSDERISSNSKDRGSGEDAGQTSDSLVEASCHVKPASCKENLTVDESAVANGNFLEISGKPGTFFSGALLVGSVSVPIGQFASETFLQLKGRLLPSAQRECVSRKPLEGRDGVATGATSVSRPADQTASSCREKPVSIESKDSSSWKVGSSETSGSVARSSVSGDHLSKVKPQSPSSGSDRSESTRSAGYDRLTVKPSSWQSPSSRYVAAKVWRAVGLVGEKQDAPSGISVPVDGEAPAFQQALNIAQESERAKSDEGQSQKGDGSSMVGSRREESEVSGFDGSISKFTAPVAVGVTDGVSQTSEVTSDTTTLVSDLCSLSAYLKFAESFLNERWRVAVEQASPEDYVDCSDENYARTSETGKCAESSQQDVGSGLTTPPGAERPSPSSIPQTADKASLDSSMYLSRIFSDSDQTGLEGVTHPTTHDDQRFDEAAPLHALSAEEESGSRDCLSSSIDSEQMSGSLEDYRSSVVSGAYVGRVYGSERHVESRGGSGSSLGYPSVRHSHGRQERWCRYPRDRFPEQRYLPRRRASAEKHG